ncbi:hypothetical protein [Nitrosopumilus sp. S4]
MLNQIGGGEFVMIYDILEDIEKYVPNNIEKTKSKILLPAYGIVKSIDFVIIASIITLLVAIMFLPNVYGYPQDEINKNGIRDVKVYDLSQNTSNVTFDYCKNKYSRDSVGVLVTSDLDSIPVPVSSAGFKYNDCTRYGTKILADSNDVTLNLFHNNEIDLLISSFSAKIHELQNKLVQTEQKIITNYNQNKSYDELTKKSELLQKQIKSAQSGIKTLISMKNG